MNQTASPVRVWMAVVAAVCLAGGSADAQSTRAEEIDQARRDKQARLWPERESPLVRQANDILERGFQEGIEDGKGANGPQFLLGGMRSGHGMAVGGGYRKTDIWQERLGFRTTGRLTLQDAYMADARLDFHSRTGERGFVNLYMKWESSPQMDDRPTVTVRVPTT